MLITFWVVVALVGLLWFPNARYAVREYLANRNKVLFTTYLTLLTGLGYLLVHITTRLIQFAQASQELINAASLP